MTVLLLITSLALVKDHTFPSFLPPHPIITLYDIQNVCFRLSLYFDMMSEPAQLGVYLEVFISGDHFSSSQMPPIYHVTVLLMPAHSSPITILVVTISCNHDLDSMNSIKKPLCPFNDKKWIKNGDEFQTYSFGNKNLKAVYLNKIIPKIMILI